jgi:glycosyltransferase involved in cell wall biosynthesis
VTGWVVVLPALDEEDAVDAVVRGFRRLGPRDVLVVDNGSRDATAARALAAGATVVPEPRRGYGRAVLAGLDALRRDPPRFVVFADCDGTALPEDALRLLAPLRDGTADLSLGRRPPGALAPHQRAGNALACLALRVAVGARVHDVPPLRAATWDVLDRLRLRESTFGLPMETVARAARIGARIVEVDVDDLARRGGRSKVAGSLGGSVRAAWSMARVVARVRREPA